MRHLNYSHLLYFWTVARDGSIAKATEVLHLTPQTISGQLKLLEESIGGPLFNRVGRRLELTDLGKLVFDYADKIFSLGGELTEIVKGQLSVAPSTLSVGITDTLPKLIAHRMIEPALRWRNRHGSFVARETWRCYWPIWPSTDSTSCYPTAPCSAD